MLDSLPLNYTPSPDSFLMLFVYYLNKGTRTHLKKNKQRQNFFTTAFQKEK
jgi:hypothetical protein